MKNNNFKILRNNIISNPPKIVWTIAGSDSGGGAGIQADLHTFQSLGVHGCSVITALTAQNSVAVLDVFPVPQAMIASQLQALNSDLPADAIKCGMLWGAESIHTVAGYLSAQSCPIVCDPVMVASSGAALFTDDFVKDLQKKILPQATIVTPNYLETERLTRMVLTNERDVQNAALRLLEFGCTSVLIKGGHGDQNWCQDYWTDGQEEYWFTIERRPHIHNHGSGCSLASAIASALAKGYEILDAICMAKAYVASGIRQAKAVGAGPGSVFHSTWPVDPADFPWITKDAYSPRDREAFLPCKQSLGFYPIVDSYAQLKNCVELGIKTIQLRIKDQCNVDVAEQIKRSIEYCQNRQVQLFINDHWQLALEYQAYGVHLGQSDLRTANISALREARMRLGVSTHSYFEFAKAHAYLPSYIAFGPIYPTTTKDMIFAPQGLLRLAQLVQLSPYPVVAIGGIDFNKMPDVLATGVDGVAVISALSKAESLSAAVAEGLHLISQYTQNE